MMMSRKKMTKMRKDGGDRGEERERVLMSREGTGEEGETLLNFTKRKQRRRQVTFWRIQEMQKMKKD